MHIVWLVSGGSGKDFLIQMACQDRVCGEYYANSYC